MLLDSRDHGLYRKGVFTREHPCRWICTLYIYINELINQLRGSSRGAMVSNIDATSPGYADDLAIASIYKTRLNNLVQTAYHYSKTWLFEFSVDKGLCMVWGRDQLPGTPVVLGNKELKFVDECKHMGVKVTNKMQVKTRILHERIGKGRNALLATRGIGSHSRPHGRLPHRRTVAGTPRACQNCTTFTRKCS